MSEPKEKLAFRFASEVEINSWNDLLVRNLGGYSVYQMKEFAEIKRSVGWSPRFVIQGSHVILILEKKIPLLGKFWYLPKGPSAHSVDHLIALLDALKLFAKSLGVFSVKIEPELLCNSLNIKTIVAAGLRESEPVLPNSSTVLVDLTPSVDEIFASLNSNGRCAIRRARKDNIVIRAVELTNESKEVMYGLMRQTADGQWNLRPKGYLTLFWSTFVSSGHGQLFFAYWGERVVAGGFGIVLGTNGVYKDGGSIRKRETHGVGQLVQWEMIKWMKDHGVTRYDLCGTPPSGMVNDESHPLFRVGRFKISLNKRITDYVGAFELPVRFVYFKIWKFAAERIVVRLHEMVHRSEWY